MRDLSEFRGSPVVLLFHSAEWNPAEREVIDTYNRLIASLPASVSAGARLVHVAGEGAWRDLTFDDDALALPVIEADASIARKLGVGTIRRRSCSTRTVKCAGDTRAAITSARQSSRAP